MTTVRVAPGIGTVAVMDDDVGQATAVKLQLEDLGIETLVPELDWVPTLDRAMGWVVDNAQAVICDVQLGNQHDNIAYNGAQLVSSLVRECKIPGVLQTGYKDDVGMWVRPHRGQIPVLVSRDETEEVQVLLDGIETCRAEIQRGRAPARETHRVPLFVEKTGVTDVGIALDARVGGWSRKASVRFPAGMLGEQYKKQDAARALVGKAFFAHVNLGAAHETDLFLENFEPEFIDPAELPLHFDDTSL